MKTILKEEMSTFENIPKIIESYISRIPESDIDRRRSKESWTIREHVYHIADVQKILLERIKTIRDSREPVIEPYFPDDEIDLGQRYKSIKEALDSYKKLRREQMGLIEKCTEEDLNKNAVHKEYRQYGIPIVVRHMIFHEYWHMYRIEELWLTRDEFFK